ncbi:hypothetical protein PHMEG_0005693 [Phytophthora megakarya]|uniref:Uncharacterized protein n=1 Tax=Phytophthora megakarya TaxID=4795 RepID=A0A225WSL0_9STRA|nr:hypothetical protein PHMEG_0005693 [Phytophthora megakarya]
MCVTLATSPTLIPTQSVTRGRSATGSHPRSGDFSATFYDDPNVPTYIQMKVYFAFSGSSKWGVLGLELHASGCGYHFRIGFDLERLRLLVAPIHRTCSHFA